MPAVWQHSCTCPLLNHKILGGSSIPSGNNFLTLIINLLKLEVQKMMSSIQPSACLPANTRLFQQIHSAVLSLASFWAIQMQRIAHHSLWLMRFLSWSGRAPKHRRKKKLTSCCVSKQTSDLSCDLSIHHHLPPPNGKHSQQRLVRGQKAKRKLPNENLHRSCWTAFTPYVPIFSSSHNQIIGTL